MILGKHVYYCFYFVTRPCAIEREVGRYAFRLHAGEKADVLIAEACRRGSASAVVDGVRVRVSALREAGIGIPCNGDR